MRSDPPDWPTVALGRLCRQFKCLNTSNAEYPPLSVTKGEGIILQAEKYKKRIATEDTSKYRLLRHGQFAYDPMSLYYGSIGWQRRVPIGIVSPAYITFDLSDEIDPYFFWCLVKSEPLQRRFTEATEGGNLYGKRRKTDWDAFSSIEISLPPLPEQRKIAAILSSVDDAIEKTQAVIKQAEVVKKGLMQELLTRGLPGRHTKFKQTEIGEMPEEWSLGSYGELAANLPGAIQSGPFGSALKHSEFRNEGILVIGIDNVLDGEFSMGSNHRISEQKFEEFRRFQARPGDLLITVMATVGRCCVVPDDAEPAIITKHVYRLSVDRERANPRFLMFCLYGIERLQQSVHGSTQGLSRPGLNKSLLMPLIFPLPPVSEQQEIVNILEGADERIRRERRLLEGLQEVKAGLMSALLSGEVRVKLGSEAA